MSRERRSLLQSQIKQLQSELEHENLADSRNTETCDTKMPMPPGGQIGYAAQQISSRDPIDDIFTFHDNPENIPHFVEIREAAKTFARVIGRHALNGKDKTMAIDHVRLAVMWANASIALGGRY